MMGSWMAWRGVSQSPSGQAGKEQHGIGSSCWQWN